MPQQLDLWLDVNGVRRQTGNTSKMIFQCDYVVSYCSKVMTLEPGDLIITGTPPQFIKVGDVVELGINGLGQQRQRWMSAMTSGAVSASLAPACGQLIKGWFSFGAPPRAAVTRRRPPYASLNDLSGSTTDRQTGYLPAAWLEQSALFSLACPNRSTVA